MRKPPGKGEMKCTHILLVMECDMMRTHCEEKIHCHSHTVYHNEHNEISLKRKGSGVTYPLSIIVGK